MPNLNISYQWLVNACNAPNIGYSQAYRRGETVGGITYYDCSSIISEALTQGGFFQKNPWFTTATMRATLIGLGFVLMPVNTAWMSGDILWKTGHTEMCYTGGTAGQGGVTMGAHTNEVPLADQVSINSGATSPSYYEELYRYPGGATTLAWIAKNEYLSESEMQNNAYCFYSYMATHGWTLEPICGALACIQHESTINPGIWQSLIATPSNGFGLVQWTPSTNYTSWADSKGYEHDDGNGQCEWIDSVTESVGQWIPTTNYPETFSEFKTSTKDPAYLAMAWEYNFERPGVTYYPQEDAQKWYDYLKNMTPIPTQPNKPIPSWDEGSIVQYGVIASTLRKRGSQNGIYYRTDYQFK